MLLYIFFLFLPTKNPAEAGFLEETYWAETESTGVEASVVESTGAVSSITSGSVVVSTTGPQAARSVTRASVNRVFVIVLFFLF
jgi:hypothetical protein